jgi:GAF domain-containing protein
MAEDLITESGSKEAKYKRLLPQLKALCEGETNRIANMANITAALKETFGYFWIGFYLIKQNELVLGPFQGSIACTRIQKGKGVCGTAWEKKEALVISNVDEFPSYIACSSLSKSEIVIPLLQNNEVIGILDVDHDEFDTFDTIDKNYLTELCTWLALII